MSVSFPLPFAKLNGTGNDFVLIDNRDRLITPAEQGELARKVCRRMFSVGADGMIFIEPSAEADFSWQFFNADGSLAEMCGNGARCAARYAWQEGIVSGREMTLATAAGIVRAEITAGGTVRVSLPPPRDLRPAVSLQLDGREWTAASINTGVPHLVLFVDSDEIPVIAWGRTLRHHHFFAPAGTNVNFVRLLPDGRLKVRTYERGVEAETMACGTGAVASAILAAICRQLPTPATVLTSGGETLQVDFVLSDGPMVAAVTLEGPARLVYHGRLTAEALL